jgi:hypothetical protein
MNHAYLEKIYNELCEEPYLISTELGVEAPNCYFKGLKFLKAATELGYMARGCVADITWDVPAVPENIRNLISKDVQERHFYIEIIIDGEKRILDPSIDSKTAEFAFRQVPFEGDQRTCFDLGYQYSDVEQIKLFENMNENNSMQEYFEKMNPFLTAFNDWIASERAKI